MSTKIPESKPKITFAINDFSGGFVNNINDAKMRINQSPDLLNMMFRNDGLMQKRTGLKVYKDLGFTSNRIFVVEPKPNMYGYICNSTHTSYYIDEYGVRYNIDTGEEPILSGCQFLDKFYFVNGQNIYFFEFSTHITHKIVSPPEGFVPNPKPAITGELKKHAIGGNLVEIWYEPCQNELEDGFKGVNIIPPNPSLIYSHKDRLYISGNPVAPNMVYITDILQLCYFPASLPIQLPPNDDVITCLTAFNNSLIIGRRDSIFSLFGNTNRNDSIDQYVLTQIVSHTGMINNRSNNLIHNMIFFVGSDCNMYKLRTPTQNQTALSTSQLNLAIDLSKPPLNLTPFDVQSVFTTFNPTENQWYIQIGKETLVYNYLLMAFTRYDNIKCYDMVSYDNTAHFLSSNGVLLEFANIEDDMYYDYYFDNTIGTPITIPVCAYWKSKLHDFNAPAMVKQYRDMYLTSESFESVDTNVDVSFEIDYIDVNKTFTIKNEVARWGSAVFGVHKFTSRNVDRSLPIILNRRGKTLRISFSNSYQYYKSFPTLPDAHTIPLNNIIYVQDENKLYLRTEYREGYELNRDRYFRVLTEQEKNQAMLVHNITGVYQIKGYR